MAITAIITTKTIKMTIMVTISIARVYGGKGGWPSKSQGVVPARKMSRFEERKEGGMGWRKMEKARGKVGGRKKDGSGGAAKAREKESWFEAKNQGTGNTEKVKEIYEVGEQNGKDKMDEVLRRSNGHRICKEKGRDPFFEHRDRNE